MDTIPPDLEDKFEDFIIETVSDRKERGFALCADTSTGETVLFAGGECEGDRCRLVFEAEPWSPYDEGLCFTGSEVGSFHTHPLSPKSRPSVQDIRNEALESEGTIKNRIMCIGSGRKERGEVEGLVRCMEVDNNALEEVEEFEERKDKLLGERDKGLSLQKLIVEEKEELREDAVDTIYTHSFSKPIERNTQS